MSESKLAERLSELRSTMSPRPSVTPSVSGQTLAVLGSTSGCETFPDFTKWADNHPQDDPCVSMEVGEGSDSQGAWIDGDCLSELIYAVCERRQM